MKLIPSPNVYKNDQCLQYSEQELLPGFNQQEYAMKWLVLQLALLGYMAAVGYTYKNHKTATTVSSMMIFGISFTICLSLLRPDWPNRDPNEYIHAFFSGHKLEPLQECVESCRTYAERQLFLPFFREISAGTAGIAMITATASVYHGISNLFAKTPELNNSKKYRQSQLEEFDFKVKTM